MRLIWRDVATRHGGVVVHTHGDGALIIFGYPASDEEDGRRAVEAALEMHEAVRLLGEKALRPGQGALVLRSGLHAGTC